MARIVPAPSFDAPRRVVLAHDWLCGRRGGEAVLEAIADTLARDPRFELVEILTMFDDGGSIGPRIDALPRTASLLNRARRARRWLLPAYPVAIAGLARRLAAIHARRPIHLLISSSSAAVKSIASPRGVPHLCYCHAPARYLWSQRGAYSGGARGVGLTMLGPLLRRWDRRTARHVTRFLANSTHVAGEIRRCYGRESTVIHPPVRTDFFTEASTPREGFWLAAGALEAYKRFDLAIEASRLAGKRLVIAGDGTDRARLERLAPCGVEFLGRVSDARLRDLYRAAELLIFPQVEDFGIVAAEAQACGCPVVARRAGGALDSVNEGESGAFFDEPAPRAIADAAARAPRDPAACRRSAERFASEVFTRALLREALELSGPRPLSPAGS